MPEHGFHDLRVDRVDVETDDTRSFVLDVPAALTDTFRYRAGQFCTFLVHVDGRDVLRSYSMSSAPEVDTDLTVTVKRVPGGFVSNWLHDNVSAGDVLRVTRPAGVFCVRPGDRPVVAYCGGSGITPVLSVVKSVLVTTRREIRLLYANRDRGSTIFAAALADLVARHPDRLRVDHHYDSEAGYPAVRDVTAMTIPDADHYVCGPAPFMDLVEGTLLGLGVPRDDILIERFGHTDVTITDGEPPDEVTVVLGGRKSTVRYQPGDTLLETARRGGIYPPFSCEAGNCATCMGILRAGTATMRANNALTDEEVAEGWVLTCQAIPRGPGSVTVEYESY